MKVLKIIGGIILGSVLLLLLVALILPKQYEVEETVTINKPFDEVYGFTKLLKNQGLYSKWQLMDPAMEHYYEGEDGTVGFISGWKSENPAVGYGEQEILAIKEGERIDFALRFFSPFEGNDKAFMTFKDLGQNQTEVVWGFEGKMAFPMNLMIPMMGLEDMISDDFQTGLQNLKVLLEK